MKKAILTLGILLVIVNFSYAQTVVRLKSGRIVKGSIAERTDQYIAIDFNGVNLTFWLDEIEDIDGEKIFVEEKVGKEFNFEEGGFNRTSAVETYPGEPLSSGEAISGSQELFQEKEAYSNVSIVPASQTSTKAIKQTSNLDEIDSAEKLKMQHVGGAVVGGIFVFMFLFWVVVYVYMAFCLQRMAQKIGTENPWLAWIPIANMYLMCKMALKPGWWIILLCIPIVNIVIMVLLWVEIIRALNKPGWLVVLMFVPLVNLILPGYLAFSKAESDVFPKTEKNT